MFTFVYDGRENRKKVEEWKVERKKEQIVNLLATVLAKNIQDRSRGFGSKSTWGRFVIAEDSAVFLLGRDLLHALDVEITFAPEGIDLDVMGINMIKEKLKEGITRNALGIPSELRKVPKLLWSQTSKDTRLLQAA